MKRYPKLPNSWHVCAFVRAHALLAATLTALLATGCGGPVKEAKLVGSWQVSAPVPNGMVFTYGKDHTAALTFPSVPGIRGAAMLGTWKLEGNLLVTTIGSMTNSYGTSPAGSIPGNAETVTVVKLTDSVMVWRKGLFGECVTLRRMTVPATILHTPPTP